MNTLTDSHAADATTYWPPPATPAPDVVDVDYGTMNRELLAEKLAAAWLGCPVALSSPNALAGWLRVVDVAIAELQGTPNA